MKKLILFFSFILFFTNVYASSGDYAEIVLENIKLETSEYVGNDNVLEIKYELIPNDIEDKKIIWEVLENKNVEVIFEEKETKTSKGTIKLNVKNLTEEKQIITIIARSNNLKEELKVTVEDEETTVSRETNELKEELEDIILKLPEDITPENYTDVQRDIEKIEGEFFDNENIVDELSEEMLAKYEEIFNLYNEYEEKTILLENVVIISVLVIALLFGLYMIFKKEKK